MYYLYTSFQEIREVLSSWPSLQTCIQQIIYNSSFHIKEKKYMMRAKLLILF